MAPHKLKRLPTRIHPHGAIPTIECTNPNSSKFCHSLHHLTVKGQSCTACKRIASIWSLVVLGWGTADHGRQGLIQRVAVKAHPRQHKATHAQHCNLPAIGYNTKFDYLGSTNKLHFEEDAQHATPSTHQHKLPTYNGRAAELKALSNMCLTHVTKLMTEQDSHVR
jgi:hypothetical protein